MQHVGPIRVAGDYCTQGGDGVLPARVSPWDAGCDGEGGGGAPGGSIGGEGRAWCAPASTQHAEDLSCDTGRSAWHWEALQQLLAAHTDIFVPRLLHMHAIEPAGWKTRQPDDSTLLGTYWKELGT